MREENITADDMVFNEDDEPVRYEALLRDITQKARGKCDTRRGEKTMSVLMAG